MVEAVAGEVHIIEKLPDMDVHKGSFLIVLIIQRR